VNTNARIEDGALSSDDERIDEAGMDSFPASDAPPWTLRRGASTNLSCRAVAHAGRFRRRCDVRPTTAQAPHRITSEALTLRTLA
jgi:hypothetical protein